MSFNASHIVVFNKSGSYGVISLGRLPRGIIYIYLKTIMTV